MIAGRSALAVIPARGGSKAVPGKNLRQLGGLPLIGWAIRAARGSRVDRTILSTDDEAIADVARDLGCEVPFLRPAALAGDEVSVIDVTRHAMMALDRAYDYVVILQPTSPLRTAADIDQGLAHAVRTGASTCVSVAPVRESPVWMYRLREDARLVPVIENVDRPERRQDAEPVFVPDGSFYIAAWQWLLSRQTLIAEDTVGYVMPRPRSVDIDIEEDFLIAEALLEAQRRTASARAKRQGGRLPKRPKRLIPG